MTTNETEDFRVFQHQHSGLFMALSRKHPGFVAHGNTKAELEGKLDAAFESFLRQTTDA